MITTKRNFFHFILLLLVASSCAGQNTEGHIKRNTNAQNCEDYFTISETLEPDGRLNKILGSYLYKSLVDVYDCALLNDHKALENLFLSLSFKKAVLYFYLDNAATSLNHYESKSRWTESYQNLLSNCSNKTILYELTDTLLYHKIDDGLNTIWSNLDDANLRNLDLYIEDLKQHQQTFLIADALVIFHNSRLFNRRDSLLAYLKTESAFSEKYEIVARLTEKYDVIPREVYIDEVYGGY